MHISGFWYIRIGDKLGYVNICVLQIYAMCKTSHAFMQYGMLDRQHCGIYETWTICHMCNKQQYAICAKHIVQWATQ